MYGVIYKMGISQLVRDIQPKNVFTTRPGRVGSVGDVIVKPRFRQSSPDMPWAYDPYWAGSRANILGSNVQDGNTLGYVNSGGPANTICAKWNGNRSFKHQYGYEHHDVQAPNKTTEPVLSWLGDVSWRRKLARPQIIKRTGTLFLVKPNGYNSNGRNRGGNYPTSTSAGGIDPASVPSDDQQDNEPVLDNPTPNNIGAIGPSRRGVQRLGEKFNGLKI